MKKQGWPKDKQRHSLASHGDGHSVIIQVNKLEEE